MVATTGVTRWAWAVAAVVAAAFIAVLAFQGERPGPGLVRFRPAGLLADWPMQLVTEVAVGAGPDRRMFHRAADGGWRPEIGETSAAVDLAERIEIGLKLLHNSAPERVFAADELTGPRLAEFGLAPAGLTVTARREGGACVTIGFGAANPLGLARYTRIDGKAEVALLPSFVAEA